MVYHAPALAQAGLPPDRVIYVEAGDEKSVLICFEEGLRLPFVAAVSTIRSVYSYATTRAGHVLVEPNFNDGSQEKNNWRLPWGLRTGLELRAQTLPFLQPHVIFSKNERCYYRSHNRENSSDSALGLPDCALPIGLTWVK